MTIYDILNLPKELSQAELEQHLAKHLPFTRGTAIAPADKLLNFTAAELEAAKKKPVTIVLPKKPQ